ncbi:ABC transporter substrate-binding protein [Paenibacillus thailandensis]|uniref:ABC transporter substrate-binding protein n=1 Tax=Paenibacillus thailandensis TaxID=393250 RepID=A0ABW5R2L4_9BACL
MKKKFNLAVALVLLFASLLSACSGGTGGSTPPAESSSAPSAGAGSNEGEQQAGGEASAYEIPEGTTITLVNGGGTSVEKQMEMYGNALKKKFPQVNFDIRASTKELNIDKMILNGDKFDIFVRSIGSIFYEMPKHNIQYDMTELMKRHNVDLGGIDPVLVDSMTTNAGGQMWGIPFLNSTLVLYYNKDMFDAFGVEYPKDGMTWDEVYETAKQFNQTKDGVQYIGLEYSNHHIVKLNNLGLSYVNPDTNLSTYDDERWKTVLDVFYKPTQDPGYQTFMAQNENKMASGQFYEGRAAMVVTLVHHAGSEDFEKFDFDWDMVAAPTFTENPGVGGQAYPEYAAIPAFSENKDAAMEVIKYLISDGFQLEFSKNGNMPVSLNKDVQAAYGTAKYEGKNQTAVFYNQFAPVMRKSPYDNDVEKKLTQYINDLALGNMNVNTLLQKAKEEADKVIAEKSGQ